MALHHFPRYNGNQLFIFFVRGIRVFSVDKAEGGTGLNHTKNDDLTNKKGEIFGIE